MMVYPRRKVAPAEEVYDVSTKNKREFLPVVPAGSVVRIVATSLTSLPGARKSPAMGDAGLQWACRDSGSNQFAVVLLDGRGGV
jgi:hypothetical protein